jgi:urocanate hydratase
LTLEPPSQAALEFAGHVAQIYSALIQTADRETGLGGKLLYAGDLDGAGRACVVAASIAGAATLVASGDGPAQKQAIRDGVADFLVNSLDEALRILKNQLRKRETVSVCVGLSPDAVECEMTERGVQPDLERSELSIAPYYEALMACEDEEAELQLGMIPAVVTWRVNSGRPQELAKLDEVALSCLDEDDWAARRWLRLSPRYLGRLAQGLRLLAIHREFEARFSERLRERDARGEIPFACEVCSNFRGIVDQLRFGPEKH